MRLNNSYKVFVNQNGMQWNEDCLSLEDPFFKEETPSIVGMTVTSSLLRRTDSSIN